MTTLVTEYRRLLVEEASIPALERAIALVEGVLGRQIRDPQSESELSAVDEEETTDRGLRARMAEHLVDFAKQSFDKAHLERARRREGAKRQRLMRRTWLALSLPDYLRANPIVLDGKHQSLLLDCLMLVFHNAFYALLPSLHDARVRAFVLVGLERFAKAFPERVDSLRLLALVRDAHGEVDTASFLYGEAVRQSDAKSHEFMSVLQQAWTFFLEHGQTTAAMSLLLGQAARIPEGARPEYLELIQQTAEAALAANNVA